MSEDSKPVRTGDVNVMDLVPCMGFCCCIFSLYTEIPDCFGSVCQDTICCLECRMLTCKAAKEEGTICKCFSADCDIVPFTTCCKARGQNFCLDARISFPPTDEIPCLMTICCITCCYKYKCTCKCGSDVRDIHESLNFEKISPNDYGLDSEWVQMVDPETGRVYYLSKVNGKTQWDKPADME